MRIGVLGSLEVVADDGRELELGGRLERRVLAALVAQADHVTSLDALTDAAFNDVAVDGAVARIQNHVSRLRKRIGAGVIVTAAAGYRLDTRHVDIDWQRFERLVEQARSEIDPERTRRLLTDALSCWRGPPFPELEEWSTARSLAGRLTESHRVAQEALAMVMLASDRATDAVGMLEALVAEQPFRERRWAVFMLALHYAGQHAEALRAFQRARQQLGEIGLDPGPELRDVEWAISTYDQQRTERCFGRLISSVVSCAEPANGRALV